MASSALKPHFHVGKKQVFLPDFVITLLRTPNKPATFAKFEVPLTFNKLDIRDYLFHAYNVRALRVRSYVEQQKVTRRDGQGKRGQWYRPQAKKFMTIEMDKPFVWPNPPKDFSAWDKETYDAAHTERTRSQEEFRTSLQSDTGRGPTVYDEGKKGSRMTKHKSALAEQAQKLLSGEVKWKPGWEALQETR